MTRWFLTLPLLLFPVIAHAATLEVTAGHSIAQALSRLSSGDTLTIHAGTYAENNLTPPSGVTIEGAPGERVVLRPTGSTAPGFELAGVSNTTIRNLTVDGSGGAISYGIRIAGQNNTVENVEVANVQNQGIAIYCAGGSNHQGCGHGGNTLRNDHVHGSGSGGCHGTTARDGFCHGVYVYSDDNVIEGGEYDHNNGWGIQTYGSNLTVTNVFVHDNVSGGIVASGTAIQVSNTVVMDNDPSGQNGGVWVGDGSVLKDVTISAHANAIVGGGIAQENVRVNGQGGSGAHLVPGQTIVATVQPSLPPAALQPSTPPAPRNFRVISLP